MTEETLGGKKLNMEQDKLSESVEKLAIYFEKANFAEYVQLLSKPWKLLWLNFISGLFRGLGVAIGMTIIFGIVVFILINLLKTFINLPVIGFYIAQLVEFVNQALKSGVKP